MKDQVPAMSLGKYTVYKILFLLLISNVDAFSQVEKPFQNKEVSHTFYISANTAASDNSVSVNILNKISEASQNDANATFLLSGNLLDRKEGYPTDDNERKIVENKLQQYLLDPLKNFNGRLIFNPGVNEWKAGGQKHIDDLESFLQDNSKAKFWPNDGCALEKEDINDEVVLVMVDSQWFLEDWDDHPYINNKCDIKTREQFFVEFKDDLKDSHGKTIIVAVHHPVMTNTNRSILDNLGGFSRQSIYNDRHKELRGRLETLASQYEDVIFVSGNDRNLQFLSDDGIPQIISGAIGKLEKAKTNDKGHFAAAKNGFAKLNIYMDGSSSVQFFEVENDDVQEIFSRPIKRDRIDMSEVSYKSKEDFGQTFKASIYSEDETDKGGLYTWLWGEHYRSIFSRKIEAPVLFLDTLAGDLDPLKEGGGQQSRSLRFINENKNEYTLRALRKSATRWLQANAIKDHYVEDYLQNTVAQRYILDFYTTAHPYAPFAVDELSKPLDIFYVGPEIYYVPKQKALGIHNDEYGDELYMWEPHVGDENKELERFGSPQDIISTSDLMLELRESKQIFVDEPSYIKARLFDMLIGDWDRHSDQWRWAEFPAADDKKMYKPIPRDRDHAFPKYDGPILGFLRLGFVQLRKMQSYQEDIKDIKWFNLNPYPLDKTFIRNAKWETWKEQANFIQQNLTDAEIEKAFQNIPEAAQDEIIEDIKVTLKKRRDNLENIARKYYDYFMEFGVITGTEEDDEFSILRKDNGETEIVINNENGQIFSNTYTTSETDEIWIYGLDGDDTFLLEGEADDMIKLKIIGGEENDIYDFQNTKKAKVYDYKSKKNTFKQPGIKKWLVDSYEINNYDPNKRKYDENIILPNLGYNRDQGFQIGIRDVYTTYGINGDPFKTRHQFGADFYFLTSGLDLSYNGEFANIFKDWNFGLEARYTTPNYTMNYFGTGNETTYDPDEVSRDFNRAQIGQWSVAPSLIWKDGRGSKFNVKTMLESVTSEFNEGDDFVSQVFEPENDVFDDQLYGGAELGYEYWNKANRIAYPRRDFQFNFRAGYKKNIDGGDNEFGYIKPQVIIDYPLHPSGAAVFATKITAETIIGDDYEFYHGATLGGNESLRGFRNERFNGKTAFYQSTDLRVGVTEMRTGFIPLRMGVSAGFDYGRIWTENDDSEQWHNSYGGGIFISGFQFLTGNLGYYWGGDDSRLLFTLGFKF